MPVAVNEALTVEALNRRIETVIGAAASLKDIWVIGETSDMRVAGYYCYFELVQKDDKGANKARIRAMIALADYTTMKKKFLDGTGAELGSSGMKVKMHVRDITYHPNYGLSARINDIDPEYTLGDAVRHREEIRLRLEREGIIGLNRGLALPYAPTRIAVISSAGAAGYQDFVNQLDHNPGRYRFQVTLFQATMQGVQTAPTVLRALSAIRERLDDYDMVVIIRGGGSTTDLAAFDNYDLGAAIARFPIPVISGIGHERDTTIPDFVAAVTVKTPTAAASWLVERLDRVLEALGRAASRIYILAMERLAAGRDHLTRIAASIPAITERHLMLASSTLDRSVTALRTAGENILTHSAHALDRAAMSLTASVTRSLATQHAKIDRYPADITSAAQNALARAVERLGRCEALLGVLSPEAVIARGFSLTFLPDGTVVRSPQQTAPGTHITTRTAAGDIHSQVLPPKN